MLFDKRDAQCTDGAQEGTLTADPEQIDGIVTMAWLKIYEGNLKDIRLKVRQLYEKYKAYIHPCSTFSVPDITAEMVIEAFRSGPKTAGGMYGCIAAERDSHVLLQDVWTGR